MNKNCPYCGTSLHEEASFCPHCAKRLSDRVVTKPPTPILGKALRLGLLVLLIAGVAWGIYLYDRPLVVDGAGEVLYSDEEGDYQLLLGYVDSRYKPLPTRVDTVEPGAEYLVPSSLFINSKDDGADATQAFLQKVERVTTALIQPLNSVSPMTCTDPVRPVSALEAALVSRVFFTSQSGTAELLWTIKMKNGDRIRLRQTYTAVPSEHVPNAGAESLISTPTDGSRFFFELVEDEDGMCAVTRDRLLAEFPEAKSFSFSGAPSNSGTLDDYLSDTFYMSQLVGSDGTTISNEQYGMFSSENDGASTRCLFLYSDATTLCGYAVGPPVKVSDGVWRFEVIGCDYDFSALYQKQAQAFAAAEEPAYIPPEELSTCGARWFLFAFNMSVDTLDAKKAQRYYLWNQSVSPYLEHYLRGIDTLNTRLPSGDASNPTYKYYYLFDEGLTLLGYTRLSSGAAEGQSDENHQSLDGAGEVTYSDADGVYQLLLSYADTRYQPVAERVVDAALNSVTRLPSCLFINYKESGADATQDFMHKVESASTELIQSADSVSPMKCSPPDPSDSLPGTALASSIDFTGGSGTAELIWTIHMKNGDTIRLRQKYTAIPLATYDFYPKDVPMNTTEELQALIREIEQTYDPRAIVNIYLPPVTYDGSLSIEKRPFNLFGNTDGAGRTTFTNTVRVAQIDSMVFYFHDIDFTGSGSGVGVSSVGRLRLVNCNVTGWETGFLGHGNAWVNITGCRFENNGIGFHFNSMGNSVSSSGFESNILISNETGVLLENVPTDVCLNFSGGLFSGNGKDIENPCNQPIDISQATFEQGIT